MGIFFHHVLAQLRGFVRIETVLVDVIKALTPRTQAFPALVFHAGTCVSGIIRRHIVVRRALAVVERERSFRIPMSSPYGMQVPLRDPIVNRSNALRRLFYFSPYDADFSDGVFNFRFERYF